MAKALEYNVVSLQALAVKQCLLKVLKESQAIIILFIMKVQAKRKAMTIRGLLLWQCDYIILPLNT